MVGASNAAQILTQDELGDAIVVIGEHLRERGYAFTTVTPETHRRVIANNPLCRDVLRDVFGWNRSFATDDLDPRVREAMQRAGLLDAVGQSESCAAATSVSRRSMAICMRTRRFRPSRRKVFSSVRTVIDSRVSSSRHWRRTRIRCDAWSTSAAVRASADWSR